MNTFDFEPEVGEREFQAEQAVLNELAVLDAEADSIRQAEQAVGEMWEPFCLDGFLMVEFEAVA